MRLVIRGFPTKHQLLLEEVDFLIGGERNLSYQRCRSL
jgi:hypothetical protein